MSKMILNMLEIFNPQVLENRQRKRKYKHFRSSYRNISIGDSVAKDFHRVGNDIKGAMIKFSHVAHQNK